MAGWKQVVVCFAATVFAAHAEAGQVLPFPIPDYIPVPSPDASPFGIVAGPSGEIWFTEQNQDRIGRIASDLHVDELPIPVDSSFAGPTAITLGPDGNLWFVERSANKIGRVTPAGTFTEFPVPSSDRFLIDIASGPDGKLWFTEQSFLRGAPEFGFVASISNSGTINETRVSPGPYSIARGPDNALWYTTNGIGRITTNGQYHVFPIGDQFPTDIAAGPDGAMWFTYVNPGDVGPAGQPVGGVVPIDNHTPNIGRITTDGVVTPFLGPDPFMQPVAITRGPEDNLWFATETGGIWRVNEAGTFQQIGLDNAEPDPVNDITAGVDGKMWWTLPNSNRIGYVDSLFFLPINLAGGGPIGLARGEDDTIWFADGIGHRIGRIDTNGSLRQFELGDGHDPYAVAIAPDGTAWFTDTRAGSIGRITPDGDFVENPIPPPSYPVDIALGPDGNFWFTDYDAGAIGRITAQGVVKRFPIPDPNLGIAGPRIAVDVPQPVSIALGPDGNLWFTDLGLNAVGRITPGGTIVEFPIPTAASNPTGITAGADGTLYFLEGDPGRVARITTAGVITELGPPDPTSFPQDITLGPDGAIWFTEFDANRLGRIARDGRITHFKLPVESGPVGIIGRSDGRLFVALPRAAQILYTDLAAAEPTRTITPIVTATRTPTPTLTVPPGSTATATRPDTATPTLTETVPPGSTPTPTSNVIDLPCPGDCDGDEAVSISEIIAAVNIALGNAAIDACVNADGNGDGEVRINDLIAAVSSALQGCPL
jgi:streptogramin lyase